MLASASKIKISVGRALWSHSEAARAVFNNFDIDKNGNISLYEIAQALAKHEDTPGWVFAKDDIVCFSFQL